MPGQTDAAEAAMLNHTLGGSGYSFFPNIWAAWNTADPTDAGNQTAEIGRTQLTGFDAAVAGQIANTNLETVDTTGYNDTNPITWVAFVTQSTGGVYFWSDQLTNPVSFTAGQTLEIPIGGFVLRLNNTATPPDFDMSDYARNRWMDHLFGTTQWLPPTGHVIRQHTGDPSQTGLANEFTGGGYAPQMFNVSSLDSVGGATRARNQTLMDFLNVQSTPLDWWTLHAGAEFLYAHDQTNKTVVPGSTVNIPPNRLEFLCT